MRVLLLETDLYASVGGGQTVYRRIVAANPGIEFVYFRDAEAANARRPANASSVRLLAPRRVSSVDPFSPKLRAGRLQAADAYARSVAGQDFDIIELPDYVVVGAGLREVLAYNRVGIRAVTIAMHGNISTSLRLAWDADEELARELHELELEQFVDANARYAISKRYVREWETKARAHIHLVDPLAIVGRPVLADLPHGTQLPSLYCIGRMERRKGNDLYVELVRWLDRSLFASAYHVGSSVQTGTGRSSDQILREIAAARGTEIEFLPNQSGSGMDAIYGSPAFTLLPVRYDTFNLVALESLFKGCPTAVSTGAGVCDFLEERLPTVPYVKIDLGDWYGSVEKIRAVLADYPAYRGRLVASLRRLDYATPSLDMRPFYEEAIRCGPGAGRVMPSRKLGLAAGWPVPWRTAAHWLHRVSPSAARKLVRAMVIARGGVLAPKKAVAAALMRSGIFSDAVLLRHLARSLSLRLAHRNAALIAERDRSELDLKVHALRDVAPIPVHRCAVWSELARLERLRGNELIAVAYEIRLLRLRGADPDGLLPSTVAMLERHGFGREALALRAMYASGPDVAQSVYDVLRAAYEHNLRNEPRPWQILDDRRSGEARVSVIVSLYDAADKLHLFLTGLAEQTLVKGGLVELILVDSASPGDERRVVEEFVSRRPLNIVYARSQARETIQAAWNRGIHLSRAPYLVFLGADETLYPEALQVLADELDRHPHIDWVMADSLVTETDEHGVLRRDVMLYDRSGATKDHAYLETCYLSWVGGMYRKSIHERFGYYDETFRAAGDTEFKNRVLPFIRVSYVPGTLGLFLNYPDARTTASPVAEIEDVRAWYLHRTAGGVRYAFEQRTPRDALELFFAALGYRKSYCRHTSCDIEYARDLLHYVIAKGEAADLAAIRDDLDRMLCEYRTLDCTAVPGWSIQPALLIAACRHRFRVMEKRHAKCLAKHAAPVYRIFNDNRFEQHSWPW